MQDTVAKQSDPERPKGVQPEFGGRAVELAAPDGTVEERQDLLAQQGGRQQPVMRCNQRFTSVSATSGSITKRVM